MKITIASPVTPAGSCALHTTQWPYLSCYELTGKIGVGYSKCNGYPLCSPQCGTRGQFHGWMPFKMCIKHTLQYYINVIYTRVFLKRKFVETENGFYTIYTRWV